MISMWYGLWNTESGGSYKHNRANSYLNVPLEPILVMCVCYVCVPG